MKNFLSTLVAALVIWVALQYLGPQVRRIDWPGLIQPAVVLASPSPAGARRPAGATASFFPANPAAPGQAAAPPPVTTGQASLPVADATTASQPVDRPEILSAVVTVTGNAGAGTGFLCNFHGKVYVATNQHVLGVGNPLTIRTSTGAPVAVRGILAAGDADIALLEPAALPPGTNALPVAALPDPAVRQSDPTVVPGNSKGDGVITQTAGKLLAVGPQRVEVDNPVYPGNSGSPILDLPTGKVIGVLTEAELVTLNEFEKESFRSKDSTIKSTVRYFGHRLDSVQRWEPLNWATFQETEGLLSQSRGELMGIVGYLTDSSTSYKKIRDLHDAANRAEGVFGATNESLADKMEAYQRFWQDLESLARRAKFRFIGRKVYYQQQAKVETINRLADAIISLSTVARRDTNLAEKLLGHRQ